MSEWACIPQREADADRIPLDVVQDDCGHFQLK
jgi:hypothetical protein